MIENNMVNEEIKIQNTKVEDKDEFIKNLPDWDLLPPLEGIERN